MIRCNIQCRFGFEKDSNGCEICRCLEPCQVNKKKQRKLIKKKAISTILSDKIVQLVTNVLSFHNKLNVYKHHVQYRELNVNQVRNHKRLFIEIFIIICHFSVSADQMANADGGLLPKKYFYFS